jgi:Response regulator of the LytR/AlgR family
MKKVLIADDEHHVCEELKYIIAREEDIEIAKICNTGAEALAQISRLQPEIVFLDIEMPGLNGIQLGYYLKNLRQQPYIIYVTAYGKFAVEAFKVGAKGYILKPFAEEEVREQIRQALEYIDLRAQNKNKGEVIPKTKLSVNNNGKFMLIDQHDIVLAYANDRSVYVRTNGKNFLVSHSLSELEAYLKPEVFFRCHRNYIINITKVREVIPWFNSTYILEMEDATQVPVSRTNVKYIKQAFCL